MLSVRIITWHNFCTFAHTYAVHLSTLWVQLRGQTDRPNPKMLNKILCRSTAASRCICKWYEHRAKLGKQSTLPSPTFPSSPLAPCHLPSWISPTSKECVYWWHAKQSVQRPQKIIQKTSRAHFKTWCLTAQVINKTLLIYYTLSRQIHCAHRKLYLIKILSVLFTSTLQLNIHHINLSSWARSLRGILWWSEWSQMVALSTTKLHIHVHCINGTFLKQSTCPTKWKVQLLQLTLKTSLPNILSVSNM